MISDIHTRHYHSIYFYLLYRCFYVRVFLEEFPFWNDLQLTHGTAVFSHKSAKDESWITSAIYICTFLSLVWRTWKTSRLQCLPPPTFDPRAIIVCSLTEYLARIGVFCRNMLLTIYWLLSLPYLRSK